MAFHLQHIAGVLDRLFTYAKGGQLSRPQLDYLKTEGVYAPDITKEILLDALHAQVDQAIRDLSAIQPEVLTNARFVGRKLIPSTLAGLLFHSAEHMQRHTGQILATSRFV